MALNKVVKKKETMKFLIVEPSPLPIHILIGPKYSSQDHSRETYYLLKLKFLSVLSK